MNLFYLLTPSTITELFSRDFGVPAEEALDFCMQCGWVVASPSRFLIPSKRGMTIVGEKDYQEQLRQQLSDFILFFQPPWSKLLPRGRVKALVSMSAESRQCFQEAGLAIPTATEEIVAWWDTLPSCSRGFRSDALLEIGRKGERLSIEYEKRRTGREPKWQSIESNMVGYDLHSVVSGQDPAGLLIEVKASQGGPKGGSFHISLNEWTVASNSLHYCFHIWARVFAEKPMMAVLSVEDVAPHVPKNVGAGYWCEAAIPFESYSSRFV